MSQVAQLERPLTKAEYADHLRCSIRWLEYRLADGLPSDLIAGKRTFRPSVADQWLRRGRGTSDEPAGRLAARDPQAVA